MAHVCAFYGSLHAQSNPAEVMRAHFGHPHAESPPESQTTIGALQDPARPLSHTRGLTPGIKIGVERSRHNYDDLALALVPLDAFECALLSSQCHFEKLAPRLTVS
jgi:hypothetical protein